jgi:altronate dehydratase
LGIGKPDNLCLGKKSLDFYSGTVTEGIENIEKAGERLISQVIDIASGTLILGETVNYCEPIEVYGLDSLF